MAQSIAPKHQSSPCPGAWKLAAGQAISLRPPRAGILRVVRGRLWVTLDGPHGAGPQDGGDQVLLAGEQIRVRARRHLVIEAWSREQVCFDWQPLTSPAHDVPSAAQRQALAEPWADLRWAAALAAGALGRLVAALAGIALDALVGRDHRANSTMRN